MIIPVYVPVDTHPQSGGIAPASGIVGKPIKDTDLIKVYFEGNLFGAENLNTYLDRLTLAAGRCAQKAPTTAFAVIEKSKLSIVGAMDTEDYSLTLFRRKLEKVRQYIGSMPLSEDRKVDKISILD